MMCVVMSGVIRVENRGTHWGNRLKGPVVTRF